jgi:hypothetical protein
VAQVVFRGTHRCCRRAVHRRGLLEGLRGEQASRPGGQASRARCAAVFADERGGSIGYWVDRIQGRVGPGKW